MDATVWLSGLTALAGVGLGGLLSFRIQERARLHQERQAWRETRRVNYASLVAAVRQYRLHVLDPHSFIEIRVHANVWMLFGRQADEQGASCCSRD